LAKAAYVAAPIAVVIPEIALIINFDTAKYNLDAGDKALIEAFAADVVKYGYTKIDISGHTDSRGGIDNNLLSTNRAKSAAAYLLSLLPNLKVTINGYADAINVATNTTVEGMAANRRAEFRVVS
jgi:peptidoglycan-associated lipoprotein